MDNKHGRARKIRFNKRHKKKHSNKTVDRLLYDPLKHKQKFKKSLRKELQKKRNNSSSVHPPRNQIMKFGSMNVQGLYFETNLAIQSIINEYNHDVSIFHYICQGPRIIYYSCHSPTPPQPQPNPNTTKSWVRHGNH